MTEPIQLSALADLDKTRVLEIVDGLKINSVVKAVVLSQLKRANDEQIKILLAKVQGMIETIRTGDDDALESLKAEIQGHAAKASIPPQYVDGLINLMRPEQLKP